MILLPAEIYSWLHKVGMKKLLLLLLIPIFSTQGFAEENIVYFCSETKHIFIDAEDGKVSNYQLDSFSFKVEDRDSYELIKMIGPIFGGKNHPLGPYTALDVRDNDSYELVAYTNGTDKRLMSYSKEDGVLQYSNHRSSGVRVVTANCGVTDF
jgi:hypothetical protein